MSSVSLLVTPLLSVTRLPSPPACSAERRQLSFIQQVFPTDKAGAPEQVRQPAGDTTFRGSVGSAALGKTVLKQIQRGANAVPHPSLPCHPLLSSLSQPWRLFPHFSDLHFGSSQKEKVEKD